MRRHSLTRDEHTHFVFVLITSGLSSQAAGFTAGVTDRAALVLSTYHCPLITAPPSEATV